MVTNESKNDLPQIGVRMETAAAMLGISVPSFRKAVRSEQHPPYLKIGECIIFPVNALVEWANNMAKDGERI